MNRFDIIYNQFYNIENANSISFDELNPVLAYNNKGKFLFGSLQKTEEGFICESEFGDFLIDVVKFLVPKV